MSETIKLNICPKCGAAIPAEAPQGLCPKCVLGGAAHSTEAGVAATATGEIPTIERIAAAFPQLEILELIGRGGMGFVFKARQPHLDRYVALKLLPDKLAKDPQFAERFNREGRFLAKLNHPNIVSVFDFGQAGGFYFLLMEYVDGVNLRQAMRAGRFSPAEALGIVPKICEALQYAHEQGVLHRDIKPENILLDAKGRVKIADFGIAKLVGEDAHPFGLTATGAALGTPHYMAPEQLEKPGEVDHRADIYSLGVVFYEMLTGELPIGRFKPPSERTPLDQRVDEIVMRALERERELRQRDADEFKTQVEHVTATPRPATRAAVPDSVLSRNLSLVKRPAQALVVVGIFNWVGSLLVMLVLTYVGLNLRSSLPPQELGIIGLLMILSSTVILVAGLKMMKLQAYPLAVAGSVLAMVTTPGNIIGLPIGVWALITLLQKETRAAFGNARTQTRAGEKVTGVFRRALASMGVRIAVATFVVLLCIGGLLVLDSYLKYQRRVANIRAARIASAPDSPGTSIPTLHVTVTSVELRDEGPTGRWLALDYSEQGQGDCELVVRTEGDGRNHTTRKNSFLKNIPGVGEVRHQRVEWLLPEDLDKASRNHLRETVAKSRLYKTLAMQPGTETPLFDVPLPKGGRLAASFGAKFKDTSTVAASPEKMAEYKAISVRLDTLRSQEKELLARYTEQNPLVIRIREQIAENERKKKALEVETNDLHAIQIRLARDQLAETRKRFNIGLIGDDEVAKAERDLAVAEARGEAVAIARANLKFAESALMTARKRHEVGLISGTELRQAEGQHTSAALVLHRALNRIPPRQLLNADDQRAYDKLSAEVASLREKAQQLSQQYTDDNPLVQRVLQQLREAETKLKAFQEKAQ
jgi:serine/threonine protein kinase